MRFSWKVLLLAFTIAVALSAGNLKYEIEYMQDAVRMSEQAVAQIVEEGLNAEINSHPYYQARVNIYPAGEFKNDYFVVYLFRSDIYFAPCFKLEIENAKATRIVEEYVEEQTLPDICPTCPDPDVQVVVSNSCPEFPTATVMRDSVANIAMHAGLKTVKLDKAQETLQAVQNYLVCPKLQLWARVGHGTTTGLILGSGTFNSSSVTALGANALQGKILHFNSCNCHEKEGAGTFHETIMKAGCYVYTGGDIALAVGNSEKVSMKYFQKIIKEKKEMKQSLTDAMNEIKYQGFGFTGQGSGPWFFTTGPYLSVNFPNGGEILELGTAQNILWGDNIDGNVKIELFKGGSLKEVLSASTASNGTFQWTIPGNYLAGNDYKVKITSIDSAALNDESNANFSISPEYIIKCPYFQNFDSLTAKTETFPVKYEQLTDDDLNWTVWNGPTPSRIDDPPDVTGAEIDKTTGTTTGKYIYTEASGNGTGYPSKKLTFVTPKFDFKSLGNPTLSFWYHMLSSNTTGDKMGSLAIDISVDGTWKNDVIKLSGNKGDKWNEQTLDLTQYKGDRVIFRFRGVTGTSWESDICIDDFRIDGVQPVTNTPVNATSSYSLRFCQSRILYQVPENISAANTPLTLKLYDMKGKLIRTLYNGVSAPGAHFVALDNGVNGKPVLSEGIYLCRMEAGDFSEALKLVIRK